MVHSVVQGIPNQSSSEIEPARESLQPGTRLSHHLVAVMCLATGVIQLCWGEKWGWYRGMGLPPWSEWLSTLKLYEPLNLYYVQRCGPPFVLIQIFKFFQIEPTPWNVVLAFGICNVLLITSIPYFWNMVAQELKIDGVYRNIGFAALIINYSALKWPFYYTTNIGDTWSYASGIAILAFWLKGCWKSLVVTTIFMAFTWPTAIFVGCALLLFPPQQLPEMSPRRHLAAFLAACLALGVLYFIYNGPYVEQLRQHPKFTHIYASSVMSSATDLMLRSIKLSYLVVAAMVYFSWKGALQSGPFFQPATLLSSMWNRKFALRLILVAMLFVGIRASQYFGSSGVEQIPISIFLRWNFSTGLTAPGVSFVCQLFFYGPLLIVALLLWTRVCSEFHQLGMGASLTLCFIVLLAPNAESRQLGNLYTLLAPFVIKALTGIPLSAVRFWWFVIISFVVSKVWFRMEPFFEQFSPIYAVYVYMPDYWYVIHGSSTIALLIIVYLLMYARPLSCERPVPSQSMKKPEPELPSDALRA